MKRLIRIAPPRPLFARSIKHTALVVVRARMAQTEAD
jgi:hypothetical protein